jgi:hypothetical protein
MTAVALGAAFAVIFLTYALGWWLGGYLISHGDDQACIALYMHLERIARRLHWSLVAERFFEIELEPQLAEDIKKANMNVALFTGGHGVWGLFFY